jgi:hypothetical protein
MWRNLFNPQFRNWHWVFSISVGIYVELFIQVFKPFQSDLITYKWATQEEYFIHIFIDFLITSSSCAVFVILLPKYFTKFFKPENLSLHRFILGILAGTLFVETGFFFSCAHFFKFGFTLDVFINFLKEISLTVIVFAVIPFTMTSILTMRSYILDKKYKAFTDLFDNNSTENGEQINSNLEIGTPQYKTDLSPIMLRINDNSNKKDLEIPLDSLYYITSDHNYVEVHYQNKNAVNTRHVLRNSLKAIEEDIMSNSDLPLIRCHKAFIINTEKIEELRGPSKSGHFILSGIETPIPVSRQKYSEFETRFPNHPE